MHPCWPQCSSAGRAQVPASTGIRPHPGTFPSVPPRDAEAPDPQYLPRDPVKQRLEAGGASALHTREVSSSSLDMPIGRKPCLERGFRRFGGRPT